MEKEGFLKSFDNNDEPRDNGTIVWLIVVYIGYLIGIPKLGFSSYDYLFDDLFCIFLICCSSCF